jgi:hypothetical protein
MKDQQVEAVKVRGWFDADALARAKLERRWLRDKMTLARQAARPWVPRSLQRKRRAAKALRSALDDRQQQAAALVEERRTALPARLARQQVDRDMMEQ